MHVAGSLSLTDAVAIPEVLPEVVPLPQPIKMAPVSASITNIPERKTPRPNCFFGSLQRRLLLPSIDMTHKPLLGGGACLKPDRVKPPYGMQKSNTEAIWFHANQE
jgi:hypothetical protein